MACKQEEIKSSTGFGGMGWKWQGFMEKDNISTEKLPKYSENPKCVPCIISGQNCKWIEAEKLILHNDRKKKKLPNKSSKSENHFIVWNPWCSRHSRCYSGSTGICQCISPGILQWAGCWNRLGPFSSWLQTQPFNSEPSGSEERF